MFERRVLADGEEPRSNIPQVFPRNQASSHANQSRSSQVFPLHVMYRQGE
jgi:hypothetical protein